MDVKILVLVLLATASQGYGVTEIRLPDRHLSYLANELIGTSIGIAKSFLDKLEVCMVTFPNGIVYEAYPNDNTPNTVTFLSAVPPFTTCTIGFIGNSDVGMSGVYELTSMVLHSSNSSHTITRQRFNITIREIELY
ncbi:hypothetical protein evm_006438 [Chilo suppressalis]|nr:hypothetical protein evm_006438 [Chilo suppressalis]